MQARLDAAKETSQSTEKQLAEIRNSIASEKATRLESVREYLSSVVHISKIPNF